MHTIEIRMGICIALSILLQAVIERQSLNLVTRFGIALLSIAPVIATILLVARYPRGEKDEYVRNLVVESMLWGLGAVLIADTSFSYVQPDGSLIPIGNISPDIFVLAVSAKLEVKLWRNQ
jgi:hypothetical protein